MQNKPCPQCGNEMTYQEGLSKTKTLPNGTPKPWAKYQCTANREHLEWVNATRPYPPRPPQTLKPLYEPKTPITETIGANLSPGAGF